MILYHSYDIDIKNNNGIWLSEKPCIYYGDKVAKFNVNENNLKIADYKTVIKYILKYDFKNINDVFNCEEDEVLYCTGTEDLYYRIENGEITEDEAYEILVQNAFNTNYHYYSTFMFTMAHPYYFNFINYLKNDNYDGYSFPFEGEPYDIYYYIFYPEKIKKIQNTNISESRLKQIVNETIRKILKM